MKSLTRTALLAAVLIVAVSVPAQSSDVNAPLQAQRYAAPLRVACVGDSITAGSGTKVRELESYPAQLQRMLDEHSWLVGNFGVSGATLMNSGDKPYQKLPAFQDALKFNRDVVIVMLGTNDSKPQNWRYQEQFVADYRDLLGKFKALPMSPRIFVCRPGIVTGAGNFGINEAAVAAELPLIDAIAKDAQVGVIDMRGALGGNEALLPDHVHPSTDGANLLARAAYRALTGGEFAGALAPVLHSEWMGWHRIDFAADGRAGLLVLPKTPAPGNPWIWRTEFFGTEPQADLALLAKGWHVAYVDVRNLYGAPAALDAMDKFYAQVVKTHRLAPQVVLEGFSRGGLFAFNWAARHPDQVASIYADAPVLDFKSWPAGKGKGQGSPDDWQQLLKVYGFTEEQALAYPLNPVNNLAPLATAKIPILSVCGGADQTVPYEENTKIAEERYRKLGGEIEVILKPDGDHHPHSLEDPKPIVDFILKHAPRVPRQGDIVPAPPPRQKGLGISGPGAVHTERWTGMNRNLPGSAVKAGLIPNLAPLIPDTQIRDTIVIVGGDGNYYLTGSSGNDIWDHNDGVELWRSPDLRTWTYLGLVWSFEKNATWQKAWRWHRKPVRALWAPELHYIKRLNSYFITLSMPPGDRGLLRSTTGRPEGPYVNALADDGKWRGDIDASLFEDDDGTVYLVYGGGWIARMKDDLSGLAEEPRKPVLLHPDLDPHHHADNCLRGRNCTDIGHEGASLFKRNGKYYLTAADSYEGRYSSMAAISDNIYGPYDRRHEAVPCGGGTDYFQDKEGNWWCAFFGNDNQAPFREKPAIVRIDFAADGKISVAARQPDFVLQESARHGKSPWSGGAPAAAAP